MSEYEIFMVQTSTGEVPVAGIRHGPFAVHRKVGAPGWTVTHIASGRAVPVSPEYEEEAVGIAEFLLGFPIWQTLNAKFDNHPKADLSETVRQAKANWPWA